MDWMVLLDIILGRLFGLLGSSLALVIIAVIGAYVVPWLKEKKLYELVKHLMASAEAKFSDSGMGILKKDWVFEQLDNMNIKYDKNIVGKLIDGFTLELTAAGILNR